VEIREIKFVEVNWIELAKDRRSLSLCSGRCWVFGLSYQRAT